MVCIPQNSWFWVLLVNKSFNEHIYITKVSYSEENLEADTSFKDVSIETARSTCVGNYETHTSRRNLGVDINSSGIYLAACSHWKGKGGEEEGYQVTVTPFVIIFA